MNKYNKINLIGLVGEAGSGKDTTADYMVEEGWTKFAFAQTLKEICINYLGLSYDDVYTQEGKLKFNSFWGMTNREILQKIGTEAFRNGFHPDTWVKIAELQLKRMLEEGKKVIVTDCRFDNEAALIEKLGGFVFQIQRSNYKSNLTSLEQKHESEKGVSDRYISRIILNDREKENLKKEFVEKILSIEESHKNIVEDIEKLIINQQVDVNIAEKLIFNIKKYLTNKIDFVCNRSDNKNLRLEWFTINNYNYVLKTNSLGGDIEFDTLSKNKKIDVSYLFPRLVFKFDDSGSWQKINYYINM